MRLTDLRLLQTYCPEIAGCPITRLSRTDLLDSLAHAWLASRRIQRTEASIIRDGIRPLEA